MKGCFVEQNTELKDIQRCIRSDVPEPKADIEADQVLVDVRSAGLNFFDVLMLAGKYQSQPAFPYVLGAELSGVISKDSPIPEGCDFIPGKTRVFGQAQGAYGEKVAVPHWALKTLPDNLTFDQGAGLMVTLPTSYGALKVRAKLQPGEWLLVHAGAGGVGICACQLGKLLGAKVIATAGSAEKLKICKEKGGADYAINYQDKDWIDQIKKITGGGVDVIYDPVGLVIPSMKLASWNARILIIGFAGSTWEKVPMNIVLLKNISLVGVHWGRYLFEEPETVNEVWDDLLGFLRSGKLIPVVMDPVYKGIDALPQGLTDLATRKTWGKAILRISDDNQNDSKL